MVRFPKADGWTGDQINFLKENYTKLPVREIAAKLNRSEPAVRTKAFQLELGRCQALTVDEVDWLKRLHTRNLGVAQMARIMKRSKGYIRRKCLLLGLPVKRRKPWRPEDDAKIIELAGKGETDLRIAKILNRSVVAVNSRRRTLDAAQGNRTLWMRKAGKRALLEENQKRATDEALQFAQT